MPCATSLIVPPGPPKVRSPKPAAVAALCKPFCAKIFCEAGAIYSGSIFVAFAGSSKGVNLLANVAPAPSIKGAGLCMVVCLVSIRLVLSLNYSLHLIL